MKKRNVEIVESKLASKTGRAEECEDAICVSDDFVAVVDGVTAKGELRWKGLTGGQAARDQICRAIEAFPANITASRAIEAVTAAIKGFYESAGRLQYVQNRPHERIMAAVVIYSRERSEVWSIGDCQFMIDGNLFQRIKKIDQILSETRSAFLELEILSGKTIDNLMTDDPGRNYILPLLKRQSLLQNHPDSVYSYPVIDGFDVPLAQITVETVPEGPSTVILASDGYPELMPSLAESEARLQQVLTEDPLCFRRYKSTKGLQTGNISFDDRAYVKFQVT